MKNLKVKDEMTTNVVTVKSDASMGEVIDTLVENRISGVVAVDSKGSGVGVLSTFDIIKAFSKNSLQELTKLKAKDIMTEEIIHIEPDKTIGDALNLMIDEGIHRVVVLSSDYSGKKPIGILSVSDIIEKLKWIE